MSASTVRRTSVTGARTAAISTAEIKARLAAMFADDPAGRPEQPSPTPPRAS